MTNTAAIPPHISKFQQLLRKLFQFDCADLDFGIYRIMNYKRDAIEEFIMAKLPRAVTDELDRGPLAQQARADRELEDAVGQVRDLLGDYVIDAQGGLDDTFHSIPVGQNYLNAQTKVASALSREAAEIAIFNHLYTFFSRYYQDGDFISKRRYAKRQRYAIPYNGEEVYLHWANSDQYYIKTAEHFHDYRWKARDDVAVHFKLRAASVEQNNVKGAKRFFLPCIAGTEWVADTAEIIIPFAYRPLTQREERSYGKRKQQDRIIAEAVTEISRRLATAPRARAALLGERRLNGKGGSVTFFEHHLRRYTRRNTSDFFIHKDLKGFLARELDFYLKNEVLNLDKMENAGRDLAEGWFQMLRLIKSVGSRIIDFLDQIESFQKMLWEKRKFITATQYCITLGSIDEDFYPDIAACDGQWDEWQDLFDIDEEQSDLFNSGASRQDRRINLLRAHPTLVADTRHFGSDFVDRLLASFDDLDGMTDGLLVHSENWQALNLLGEKCRESVKCVYIDPPYNTNASAILYKNDYKDSSWLSMMENRLKWARASLTKKGILCVAIDDEEVWRLRGLLQTIFEKELGIAVIYSNPQGRARQGYFSPAHEYALFYGRSEASPGSLPKTKKQRSSFPHKDELGYFLWDNLIRRPPGDNREDRPKLFYPIYIREDNTIRIPKMIWNEDSQAYDILETPQRNESVVWPVKEEGEMRIEKRWRHGWQKVTEQIDKYRVRQLADGSTRVEFRLRMKEEAAPKTWWGEGNYAAARFGTTVLQDILAGNNFDFPKSFHLVSDCLRACNLNTDGTVLDYFAGSGTTGHAVINLNREDGGQRKFILVEMGDYFDTVLLPRIKKVTFAPAWRDGKPKRMATAEEAGRSPRIVKYIRLESYEDALNNIEIDSHAEQTAMRFGSAEYLLNYMLKWETKRSETLLNVEKLASPFRYRLNIRVDGQTRARVADVPETFNYLLGLHVRTRRVCDDGGRPYLVYQGETRENPGQVVAVIWRETDGWGQAEFERDKRFVVGHNLVEGADVIYVNGDSFIGNAKTLDPLFKSRMFAGARS